MVGTAVKYVQVKKMYFDMIGIRDRIRKRPANKTTVVVKLDLEDFVTLYRISIFPKMCR